MKDAINCLKIEIGVCERFIHCNREDKKTVEERIAKIKEYEAAIEILENHEA